MYLLGFDKTALTAGASQSLSHNISSASAPHELARQTHDVSVLRVIPSDQPAIRHQRQGSVEPVWSQRRENGGVGEKLQSGTRIILLLATRRDQCHRSRSLRKR